MRVTKGEARVYSDFLTSLAVAWFSGGIITPMFTGTKNLFQVIAFIVAGMAGALLSLKIAIAFKADK